jgi:hypothetical protein
MLKTFKTYDFHFMTIKRLLRNIHSKTIVKPECQRAIDREQVGHIYKYQIDHFKKFGEFFFTSPITLAKLEETYYVVDGQHRLACIEMINNSAEYSEFEVPVVVLKVNTMEELDAKYIAINQNRPVPLPADIEDWKKFGGFIDEYLTQKCACYFSNTDRPNAPNFNKEKLLEYINKEEVAKKVDFDHKRFIEEMKSLNFFYLQGYGVHVTKYFNTNLDKKIERAREKNCEEPFVLGIFRNFEWVQRIIDKITLGTEFEQMRHMPINYREKIKKATRREVWNKYFSGCLEGKCYSCCRDIDYDTFECGHVKAVFFGGATSVSNMEPICGQCNREMGVKNLYDYKRELEIQAY